MEYWQPSYAQTGGASPRRGEHVLAQQYEQAGSSPSYARSASYGHAAEPAMHTYAYTPAEVAKPHQYYPPPPPPAAQPPRFAHYSSPLMPGIQSRRAPRLPPLPVYEHEQQHPGDDADREQSSAPSNQLTLEKDGIQFFKGFVFLDDSDSEVTNILSMQSMFATVGSLLAGVAMSVAFCTSYDEVMEAHDRLYPTYPTLADALLWAPAASSAVGFTTSMVSIVISLSLYIALAACNFPANGFDQVTMMWVQKHYWLLVAEKLAASAAVMFIVLSAFFIGAIKFPINPMSWASFGYVTMSLVTIIFSYCAYVHHTWTLPQMRETHVALRATKAAKARLEGKGPADKGPADKGLHSDDTV